MGRLLNNYVITQRAWQTNVVTGTYHRGIDIAPTGDRSVHSHSEGYVVGIVSNHNYTDKTGNSYGNYIKIKHPNGMYTLYAHLNKVYVTLGQEVNQGEVIGEAGMTGRATGIHLHFEVFNENNEKINPNEFIEADLPNMSKEINNVEEVKSVENLSNETYSIGETVLVLDGYLTQGSDGSGLHTATYDGNSNPNDKSNWKVISQINWGATRPYHLRRIDEQGATPMGWASKDQIRKL